MPFIRGIATAVPPYRIEQLQARSFAAGYFADLPGIGRLLPVFDHAGIDRRYFSRPAEWFLENRSFAEKNQVHLEAATELGTRVVAELLAETGEDAKSIDAIFVVNSTGIATPSLDVRLLFRLGLRSDVRRIPIWGLGCAGGVAGLAHAASYLEGRPNERVLLVSLELCGLTFLAGDHSRSNLVACALFGEGAAAVLVDGDARDDGNEFADDNSLVDGTRVADSNGVAEGNKLAAGSANHSPRSRVRFLAAGSTHYPDSLDVMGWHVVDEGLQVVFAQRIPDIVRREARAHFQSFLAKQGRTLTDIDHFLFHPGGVKVLEAYTDVLDVSPTRLERPQAVLRNYGNMSSVTVLFVLAEHLEKHAEQIGTTRRSRAQQRDIQLQSKPTPPSGHRDEGWKRSAEGGAAAALAVDVGLLPPRWSGEPVATTGRGIALLSALGPGFSSESLLLEIV